MTKITMARPLLKEEYPRVHWLTYLGTLLGISGSHQQNQQSQPLTVQQKKCKSTEQLILCHCLKAHWAGGKNIIMSTLYLPRQLSNTYVYQKKSVSAECVFSTAGDIVTAQRSSLTTEHADQLLFFQKNLNTPKHQFSLKFLAHFICSLEF